MPSSNLIVAFDKASSRTVDAQGFMHVAGCNISKSVVNPYRGSEIDGDGELGLDPKTIYNILRPADELEKAASTFNNLPLMDMHIEVGAFNLDDPDIKKHMVGTTGQCAEFKAPYLVNDLVLWTAGAIAGVDSKELVQLSCSYRYKIDMTPGEFNGEKYDGRMSDIKGNHVALVEEGRAGPDVVVKDSALVVDGPNAVVESPEAVSVLGKLMGVKKEITEKMKPGVEGPQADVLDDLTGALDVAIHHLLDYEESDSITVEGDENPEGINQYTGGGGTSEHTSSSAASASAKAIKMEKAAAKSGSTKMHDLARNEHAAAHHAHVSAAKSASASMKPWHEHMAKAHSQAAEAHAAGKTPGIRFSGVIGGHATGVHDSITVEEDENPEGANQYAGASHEAHTASTRAHAETIRAGAQKSGRSTANLKAAKAHSDAARAHQTAAKHAPDGKTKEQHLKTAQSHQEKAGKIGRTAHAFEKAGDATQPNPKGGAMKTQGGIVEEVESDENPEGINQYTGGGGGRTDAQHGHLGELHRKTATAHREAAAAAAHAGNPSKEMRHYGLAQKHDALAKAHASAGGERHWENVRKAEEASRKASVKGTIFERAHDEYEDSITEDIAEREDVMPKEGITKYGEVTFADPKNKKYPLDTPERVRSAASYWGRPKNRNKYSEEDQAAISKRIDSAKRKFAIGECAEKK